MMCWTGGLLQVTVLSIKNVVDRRERWVVTFSQLRSPPLCDYFIKGLPPMKMLNTALGSAFAICVGTTGFAQELDCTDFGSINFFEKNTIEHFEMCAETVSEDVFLKVFEDGNTISMNAVIAGVNSKSLDDILSWYAQEEITKIFQHRNFDDISIVHLMGVAELGPRLLVATATWGADINILKDKREGSLLNNDRGVSALHFAIENGASFENIFALLALGIDAGIQDKNGNIALNYAVSSNVDFDTLNVLQMFTDYPVSNDKGYNALHFAAAKIKEPSNLEALYLLTDEKYFDDTTEAGETILHLAAASADSPDLFQVTLDFSAEIFCEKDSKSAQAIDYAKRNVSIAKSQAVLTLQNQCN